MKQLPKSLSTWRHETYEAELRKPLAKLTGDGRARLVYDLLDKDQPLPHVAVFLVGREIRGWVLRTTRVIQEDEPGLSSIALESIVLAGTEPTRHASDLTLLRQRDVTIVESEHSSNYRSASIWHGRTCEDLTYRFGMIETISMAQPRALAAKGRENYARALLPSDKGWNWEAVSLLTARMRAKWDREVRKFWKLPSQTMVAYKDGLAIRCTTLNRSLQRADLTDFTPAQLRGATHFEIEKGSLKIEAERNLSDALWRACLRRGQTIVVNDSYRTGSGARALELTLATFMAEGYAPRDQVDISEGEVADFMELVREYSIRAQQLDFASIAFGDMPPPDATPQADAAVAA